MNAKAQILDGCSEGKRVMVGAPEIVWTDAPRVLWWREERGSLSELVSGSPGREAVVLDHGVLHEPALAAAPDGRAVALWCRADEDDGWSFRVWACDPSAPAPAAVSGTGASAPAAAFPADPADGQPLCVFSRIDAAETGAVRRIEAAFGPAWGAPFVLSEPGWCSRPAVCPLDGGRFFVAWDRLAPGGGSVHGRLVGPDGELGPVMDVLPAAGPGIRTLFASCASCAPDLVLLTALRVEDVTGDHGIIDQHHTVAAALVDVRSGLVEQVGCPVDLDHGLLLDPAPGIPAKGYLGLRRQPRLLPGGTLYWERRESPDEATPRTAGCLCCRSFRAEDRSWSRETALHRGGLAYRMCPDGRGGFRAAYRTIEQGAAHRLWVEHVHPGRPVEPDHPWSRPEGWRPARLPVARRPEPPAREAGGETLRLYWGDLHVHSALSFDAEGEPDELLHYGRDLARLDFMALIENDDLFTAWLTRAERLRGDELAERWSEDGAFVVISGFEYTWQIGYGTQRNHRTVLLPHRGGAMIRWSDAAGPAGDYGTPEGLKSLAEELDALLVTQHQRWELADTEREAGLEVVSGWYTYFHNPVYVHRTWASGRRIAVIGASDSHRRNAGLAGALTGIWTSGLTPAGVLRGIRSRRTLATQGRRPVVWMELRDERGNRLCLGDHGRMHGRLTAAVHVRVEEASGTGVAPAGAAPEEERLELVELKHGDRVLANWSGVDFRDGGRELDVEHTLPPKQPEPHLYQTEMLPPYYVYLRIRHAGADREYTYNAAAHRGPWAWTSPIWWEWD